MPFPFLYSAPLNSDQVWFFFRRSFEAALCQYIWIVIYLLSWRLSVNRNFSNQVTTSTLGLDLASSLTKLWKRCLFCSRPSFWVFFSLRIAFYEFLGPIVWTAGALVVICHLVGGFTKSIQSPTPSHLLSHTQKVIYDKISDVVESWVRFASKDLTNRRMQ